MPGLLNSLYWLGLSTLYDPSGIRANILLRLFSKETRRLEETLYFRRIADTAQGNGYPERLVFDQFCVIEAIVAGGCFGVLFR